MSTPRHNVQLSRRTALKGAVLGGTALALGVPGLTACSSGDAGSATAGETVDLPTYKAPTGLSPDLVGDSTKGIQDGFFSMPTNLVKSVDGKPMNGGELTVTVPTLSPPPPPLSQNSYAQAINARLGGTLTIRTVPSSEYGAKISAMMAGANLTDMVLVQDFGQPRLDKLLRNQFTDVSDHLSGDKVSRYPNLAAIPPFAWKNTRMFGRIWGVPIERPLLWNMMFARSDLLIRAGVTPESIASTDDFEAMCAEVNDPKRNQWALTGSYGSFSMPAFAAAFGAPNGWRKNSDGTLTRDWETSEYAAAVEFVAKLKKAGYFHPRSASLTGSQMTELFVAGQVAAFAGYLSGWSSHINVHGLTLPQVTAMPLFSAPGKQASLFYGTGVYGVMLMKKGDPERVQECLRVLDFYASPFGTEEHLLAHFGNKDTHHQLENGQPVKTETGSREVVNVGYLSGVESRVMYSGKHQDWVRAQYAWEKKVAPRGLANPTIGRYSETATRAGDENGKVDDAVTDVIMGRKPMDAFTAAVKAWKNSVGDKIRDELGSQLS